jgi:hypothetical protein
MIKLASFDRRLARQVARLSTLCTGIVLLVVVLASACASPSGESRTITLTTLNDSGVTGNVVLTDIGAGRTRVVVSVDPGGNLDMPAHIHPGSCANLVPQPRYPLRNVAAGSSSTDVPAPLSELLAGDLAINLHHSNDDLQTYTACADLR